MNAVIDEDLPRSFGTMISDLGFKVFDVRDCGLRGSADSKVFAFAKKHKAVLFSADLGFSNTLVFRPGGHYGICVVRFPNEMTAEGVNIEVSKLLEKLSTRDYLGSLIILSPGKIRIRRSRDKG